MQSVHVYAVQHTLFSCCIFVKNGTKMSPCWSLQGTFLRKMQKVKSVFGLHIRGRIAYEPIPENTQRTPKIEKKTLRVSSTRIFASKTQKNMKNYLQRVSKWVRVFWCWRPLGHLWRPSLFFETKSASKRLQK